MKRIFCFIASLILALSQCVYAYAGSESTLDITLSSTSNASNMLYGISLEGSGLGLEAGLGAQMLNNGSFEYADNNEYAWEFDGLDRTLSNQKPMNKSNTVYEVLSIKGNGFLRNLGFVQPFDDKGNYSSSAMSGSIHFEKGEIYEFSCWMMNVDFDGNISVYFDSNQNKHEAQAIDTDLIKRDKWTYVSAKLTAAESETGAIVIKFAGKGSICIDQASLVPIDSYGYGREEWKYSSLNKNVFQAIKELNPSFVVIPDVTRLKGEDNEYYCWKNTLGALEQRRQSLNDDNDYENGVCSNYSAYLGYHEYFQLCNELEAMPVVQVNAGINNQQGSEYEAYLQALNKTYMTDEQFEAYLTQQFGYKKSEVAERIEYINSLGVNTKADFDAYVSSISLSPDTDEFSNFAQDILDLIEYANGDSEQTYWGSLRKQNGSEKPFELRYIQIGANNYGEAYWRNFEALKKIINEKYPDIIILASGGENGDGEAFDTAVNKINSVFSDCMLSEKLTGTKQKTLYSSRTRFDSYSRSTAGVLAGFSGSAYEKGSDIVQSNIFNAVDCASYMLGAEKNGDTVKMIYCTDLLSKFNTSQKSQSLIWFDNEKVTLTPEYYAQMLFANNVALQNVNAGLFTDNDDISSCVSYDESTQSVYVKLVNTGGKKEKIRVNLSGTDGINAVSEQSIFSQYKTAKNTPDKQSVAPTQSDVEFDESSFVYEIQPYSAGVIRIAYGNNEGMSFYTLNENMNTQTKGYVPMSVKMFILMVALIFVATTVITYLVYSKTVLKGKKFKFNFKKSGRKKGRKDNEQ